MSGAVLVHTVAEVRRQVRTWRDEGLSVAFVPTMGNLHRGHVELARLARAEADRVVMSVFVNPTQFGPGEDFESYPRTLDEDRARVDAEGLVDLLFAPDVGEMYPSGPEEAFTVGAPPLAGELCGATRPGHFDGVASVVLRLLLIVTPDTMVMGRKDYQQLVILRRMVSDLHLAVRVLGGETVRQDDGLAMSSRNGYLSADARTRAPALYRTLTRALGRLRSGDRDFTAIEQEATAKLEEAGFRPDYVEVRRSADLSRPVKSDGAENLVVLGAAWLDGTRLIDNVGS